MRRTRLVPVQHGGSLAAQSLGPVAVSRGASLAGSSEVMAAVRCFVASRTVSLRTYTGSVFQGMATSLLSNYSGVVLCAHPLLSNEHGLWLLHACLHYYGWRVALCGDALWILCTAALICDYCFWVPFYGCSALARCMVAPFGCFSRLVRFMPTWYGCLVYMLALWLTRRR